ncbi:Alternative oxidase, mitochondrial precursor [Cymbomonas tetramitiformis]|uniref:Ubiquinol oxidase n=1 Tax=Cymbomonas tetramitiformis TaxID=36881 RepID=A0AAE0EPL2_9CHLO|nr:Alternative oxidase, mitochondrial precursor [Cymbomonas tetramitiformis]
MQPIYKAEDLDIEPHSRPVTGIRDRVPGMVAGMLRHMTSLRTMKRDHGWIHTLLEEAENERMHLLTFLQGTWRKKLFAQTATLRDVVLAVRADEACHSHVNHTFAEMDKEDTNPFSRGDHDIPKDFTQPRKVAGNHCQDSKI